MKKILRLLSLLGLLLAACGGDAPTVDSDTVLVYRSPS